MKDKKEKKRWGLILFIVFIMIGTSVSFVFFGFSPATERVKYNGFSFVNNGNMWIAKISGREAAFSFLPSEVESVLAFEDFSKRLQGKLEIDVTYDLNSTYKESIALANHQMGLTLAAYGIFVRKGFTTNNTFNLPIITCDNATINVPVVYFRQGNTTNINIENNCIIAEASANADFIMVKDRLLYGMLGVMK
ncbi:hypothetical protein J4448_05625 [Candidatus Woesearchaeota archaeon]|nr:hypothetical protein [Candidatus Woesearchaeota archaeon]